MAIDFDFKNVLNPTGQVDNHVLRELFEDLKTYLNDSLATDLDLAFATQALDNLSSVAINTSLVSDTDNTDDLGTSSISWRILYLDEQIKHGSAICLQMNSSGAVTQPNQPSFLATNNVDNLNVTGDGTVFAIPLATEVRDRGSNFASSTFTAPLTGDYSLQAMLRLAGISSSSVENISFDLITSNRTYFNFQIGLTSDDTVKSFLIAVIADMDANDTASLSVTCSGGSKGVDVQGGSAGSITTWFSGSLLN